FSFTITAQDQFNNTAAAYTGKVHLTSTDSQAVLLPDYTFTTGATGDNGVHTFSATLKTAGSQTLTATDTVTRSITGTRGSIAVTAAAATRYLYTPPLHAAPPTSFSFTITAQDPFNNTAAAYTGKVHLTSTDNQAILPADYTFTTGTGADN